MRRCDPDTILVPSYTAQNATTGLGLAASSRIIKDLGGNLEADTLAGKSITFTVTLPSEAMPQTAPFWIPRTTPEGGSDY